MAAKALESRQRKCSHPARAWWRRVEVAVMTAVTTERRQQWRWWGMHDKGDGGGGTAQLMDNDNNNEANKASPRVGMDADGEGQR